MKHAVTPQEAQRARRVLRAAAASLQQVKEDVFMISGHKSMKFRSHLSAAKSDIDQAELELAMMTGELRVSPESQAKAESYIRRKG